MDSGVDGVINVGGGNVDMWWCCGEVDIDMDIAHHILFLTE